MNEHSDANQGPQLRRAKILELLNQQGQGQIEELASQFGVSGMTIRRDLQDLADRGQVIRTHGGAAPGARVSFEFRFLKRVQEQAAEKQQIAQVATQLVESGQSVLLDSSTTTLEIARQLKAIRPLTVITTSLPIASELFGQEAIEVLILGGRVRNDSPDLLGALTDYNLEMLRADIAFIGVDAIDHQGNAYNTCTEVGRMLSRMAQAAAKVYAVADHTKIGRRELMRFANVAEWAGLICDDQLSDAMRAPLRRAGINILQPSTVHAASAS